MADPLAAGHELPVRALPEGVAHAAVVPRKAHAFADDRADIVYIVALDGAHRPVRDDEVERAELFDIRQALLVLLDVHLQPLVFKQPLESCGDELRLVTVPAANKNKYFFHTADPFLRRRRTHPGKRTSFGIILTNAAMSVKAEMDTLLEKSAPFPIETVPDRGEPSFENGACCL